MTHQEYYNSHLISMDEALDLIKSGDCVASGHYGDETCPVLRNIHKIADRVENVTVWLNNPQEDYPFLSMPELNGKIDILTAFYAAPHRRIHDMHRVSYAPNHLHYLARCMTDVKRPNIFFMTVTPMDKNGLVLCACCLQYELELMEQADIVVFQCNPNLPHTVGQVQIPIEKADYIIEPVDEPIVYAPEYEASESDIAIAKNVASLIEDGDCLQFGIGSLPGAIAEELKSKNDLGVHTEMFSTPMGMLMKNGNVTNQRKTINVGQSICTFMWGDRDFYEYVDYNPAIRVLQSSYVNDPFVIAQNDHMVSCNSAMQVDLSGQICSERVGFKQFSGTGGAYDFAYGAFHSKGGKGIMCVKATAKNGTVSRIVPGLDYGSVVSVQRNVADYIVTEYGIAHIRNMCIRDRVNALIEIAAPQFRDELREKAKEYKLW